jgi:hypothetical protein
MELEVAGDEEWLGVNVECSLLESSRTVQMKRG